MAKLKPEQVKHIAILANLPLTEKEEIGFADQLSKIVDYFDELSKVDTSSVAPTFSPVDLQNVLRQDSTEPSLTQEEALRNAPKVDNGMFVVEKVKHG